MPAISRGGITHNPVTARELPLSELTNGFGTVPRECVNSTTTMTSQTARYSFFTAPMSATITKVAVYCTGAAGATPTKIRFGIYTVAANGDITLVANTAHDAALLVTTIRYEKALASSYAVTAGTRYAVGLLVVTAAAAPTIAAHVNGSGALATRSPRIAGAVASLSEIQNSEVEANLGTTPNSPYFELLTS